MDPRVLIVDDELRIADMLARLIGRKGYRTTAVYSYDEAVAVLSVSAFHLALIDYVMPGMGGVVLAKYVKKNFPSMGIIIISSMPDLDLAREGIGVADRYLDKTQSLKPLLTAMQNVLKEKAENKGQLRQPSMQSHRTASASATPHRIAGAVPVLEGKLEVGPLSLNFDRQEFFFNQAALDLSPIELKILFHLAVHANEPRSAAQLAQSISSSRGKKVEVTRIRGVIHSLRRKLEPDPSKPRHLVTIENRGYRWDFS